jgi:deoxyribodipyrimidine photolyase
MADKPNLVMWAMDTCCLSCYLGIGRIALAGVMAALFSRLTAVMEVLITAWRRELCVRSYTVLQHVEYALHVHILS